MRNWRLATFAVFYGALSSPAALAFNGAQTATPGTHALQYAKRFSLWAESDVGVVDGAITTSPPGTTKLDRRLETYADLGFDVPLGPRFGLRVDFAAEVSKRRQSEERPPRATIDETVTTAAPSADLIYITEKGLELFVGAENRLFAKSKQLLTSANGESESRFHQASVVAKRFGVVRRAGAWSGGFYYVMGNETTRKVEKTAYDGSANEAEDKAFVPSRLGVMGAFKALAQVWDFELGFVQARSFGPKDEQGHSAYTDYFTARFGATTELTSGLALVTSLFHQTLSYASSAFVSLDTIPVTSLKLAMQLGTGEGAQVYLGAIYAFGRDGQSLPEFNAKYRVNAMSAQLGARIPL